MMQLLSGRDTQVSVLTVFPPSFISFDEWVFNTEAHPLKIVTRHDNEGSSGDAEGKGTVDSVIQPLGRKHGKPK